MARRRRAGRLPEMGVDGALAQRGEGKRADEALSILGQHDIYQRASLAQLAHEIGHFVGGDAAADADDDAFSFEHARSSAAPAAPPVRPSSTGRARVG